MPPHGTRKPLPPRVLDLAAPQYPLPLDAPSRTRARPPRGAVVGGGGGGDLDRSTGPFKDHDPGGPTTTTARGLARAVARYLRERLGTVLAAEMVSEYGAVAIARTLPLVMRRRLVAEPVPDPTYEEIRAWRAAGARGQIRRPARERIVWEPAPGLRCPGGVLRRRLQAAGLTTASRNGYHSEAEPATGSRRLATGG